MPHQLEGSISQGELPGRGNRNHFVVSMHGWVPPGITPACPITTFLSQRLIDEHTLRIPHFHSGSSTTGTKSTAMDYEPGAQRG